MLRKVPDRDSIITLAGEDTTFKIEYDDHRWYHVSVFVNDSNPINAPLGGESFAYTESFTPGRCRVQIIISETTKQSEKAESPRARELRPDEGQFEWDVVVVDPDVLFESDFERVINVVENILTLITIGAIAKSTAEYIKDYSESLPEDQQDEIQSKIDDYLED